MIPLWGACRAPYSGRIPCCNAMSFHRIRGSPRNESFVLGNAWLRRILALTGFSPFFCFFARPDGSFNALLLLCVGAGWTREEENKTLNAAVNAGFLAGVVLIVISVVVGVDSVRS